MTHDWGAVQDDPDVRAFSRLMRRAGQGAPLKKRHHFIAATYLDGFCAEDGRLWAYHLDDPANPHPKRPREVGFSNYYFSYMREDGSRDDNRFEDLWAAIETVWPETLRAVRARRISHAVSFNVLGMAVISRVRVPAARHVHEQLLATKLRSQVQGAEKLGVLPAEFQRYAGQLDTVPVAANPEQSLRTMAEDMRAFGDLCFRIGFEVLHNETDLAFITSDNPVCIYDPRKAPLTRRPYEFGDKIELLFALDRRTLLRGSHRLRPVNEIGQHRQLTDRAVVRRYNNTIAQFAYSLAVASDRNEDSVIAHHSAKAPTIEIRIEDVSRGVNIHWRHAFATKPVLAPYIDTPEKAARLEAEMAAKDQASPPHQQTPGDPQHLG